MKIDRFSFCQYIKKKKKERDVFVDGASVAVYDEYVEFSVGPEKQQ